MKILVGLVISAAAVCLLMTCRSPLAAPGVLTVVGAPRTTGDAFNNFAGTVDCSPVVATQSGQHATEVGTTSYCTVTVKNSGTGNVTIQGAELVLLNLTAVPQTVSHNPAPFSWASGPPNLPATLTPGQEFSFAVAFSPTSAGNLTASIELNTTAGMQQIAVTGEGGWIVTLKSDNSNTYNGKIVKPILVAAGTQAIYVSVSQTFTIEAQTDDPLGLTGLSSWTASGNATFPAGTTQNSQTTVTVTGNTTITATFASLYVFVTPGGGGTATGTISNPAAGLAAGITALGAGTVCSPCKGIVMAVGSYNLTGAVDLPAGTVRGGYSTTSTAFDTRTTANYQSSTARLNPTTGTVINTNGYDLLYDGSVTSGLSSTSLLEGIALVSGNPASAAGARSDNMYAALGVENGAAPTLSYDTLVGGNGASPNSIGVYVYNASPTIASSVLSGSSTSATGGRSVGLWVNYLSSPSVSSDTISGGTASGSNGVSYGILNENYAASPTVNACTIDGGFGSATAAGIWTAYGGQPSFTNNRIYTENKASVNYGIYLGPSGAIAALTGNNIYNSATALLYDYPNGQSYTSIAGVNANFVTGSQTPNTSVP